MPCVSGRAHAATATHTDLSPDKWPSCPARPADSHLVALSGAIAALMAADVPAQADFGLDVLPQALGPLLTRPKLWHLLGTALCALVCAKTWMQATTSDYICARGIGAMEPGSTFGTGITRIMR